MNKIKDLEEGRSELICEPLRRTGYQLCFFEQYRYMQERVDAYLGTEEIQERSGKLEKGCVCITGTPGTGKRRSTYYLHLTALLGKTTFLYYYLARRLAERKITMLYDRRDLFLFTAQNTIYYSNDPSKIGFEPWFSDAVCLIHSDPDDTPPHRLVNNYSLFIIQVASPNPIRTAWTKRRSVRQFILNPPGEGEVVKASVILSTLPPSVILIALDYVQSFIAQHRHPITAGQYSCRLCEIRLQYANPVRRSCQKGGG